MALINLNPAHDKAREVFSRKTPESMAKNSELEYNPDSGVFSVNFLGRKYSVEFPEGRITAEDGGDVPLEIKICILHYLTHSGEARVEGNYISFKELPSGSIYVPPFTNRAIRPLVAIFGNCPEKMIEAGEKLGGKKVQVGDYAVTIPVFPKIPITFALWEGDDEFPPSGNVLFDSSAPVHLETEDYAFLPGLAIFTMKRLAGL